MEEACELSRTRYLWIVDGRNDYSRFDWTWEPVPWEANQTHLWPSQHQANGGTYLIPKTGGTDVNRDHSVIRRIGAAVRVGVDHGNGVDIACREKTRYISDYLGTLRRILSKTSQEYVWIVSSVCDYTRFDFTWHPSEWQQDMLHVFASNEQKFGDTFYVHIPTFMQKTSELALLEWFDTIHFVENVTVPRRPMPTVKIETDSMVPAVWAQDFTHPLMVFYKNSIPENLPTVNLWREKTKTVIPLDASASCAIVPRECKNYIVDQIYDYPNIDKTYQNIGQAQPQDIVFISYDEPQADANWEKLKSKFPRAIRIHGVKGMENALQAAATASTTPWYFAVFAKTELAETFEFDFVPDYFQQAKHYIFDCKNTLNGLTYGHMGVILYNCRMVLEAAVYENLGLDYTLSFPHEVVPELSCYGNFNSTPYHTWRTAFRETSKLAYFNSQAPTVDNEYRLKIWSTQAQGEHAEWCIKGAQDGLEFFKETQGFLDLMKQSFRWEWLRQRFVDRHGNLD